MKSLLKFSVLYFIVVLSTTFSQDFGDISEEEFNLVAPNNDLDTEVIIIFDKSNMVFNREFELEIERHIRFKVLKESGKNKGDIVLRFWHEDEISNIEASVYTPDGEEIEFDDDNIIETVVNKKFKEISFSIPGIQVGSIVEYSFNHWSEYISSLEPWVFQKENYTMLSQISIDLPAGFQYSILTKNTHNINIEYNNVKRLDPINMHDKIVRHTWTAKNIPGLKKEPFINCMKDYYASMLFQLSSYKSPYAHIKFAKSWNDIAKSIYRRYDDLIEQDEGLYSYAHSIVKDLNTNKEKIEKLYNFVCNEITTTKHKTLYGAEFKEPIAVYNERSGSSSEKNILLINLLNHLDLDAKPFMISTKANGEFNSNWVQRQQFNRAMVYLSTPNRKYFMFTGEKYCPLGTLPPYVQVRQGLVVNGEQGNISSVYYKRTNNRLDILTEVDLKNENKTIYKSLFTFNGYNAVAKRNALDDNTEEYIKDMLKGFNSEALIDSFKCTNLDSIGKPLNLYIEYKVSNQTLEAGNLIYFSPPYYSGISKNPFIREKRDYSIFFPQSETIYEKVIISLPPNIAISELPENKKFFIKDFNYSSNYSNDNNKINCSRFYKRTKNIFGKNEYSNLRTMYDEIISADKSQIVLTDEKEFSENTGK